MAEAINRAGKWIGALIILAIILFAFFGPQTGLLNKVGSKSLGFLKFVGIIKEDTYVTSAKAPEELETRFNSFYKLLFELANKSSGDKIKPPCFLRYDEFPDLKLFQILMNREGNSLYLKMINPQKQVLEFEKIEGLKPCVIAGWTDGKYVSERFFDTYINGKARDPKDFCVVDQIKIKKDEYIEANACGHNLKSDFEGEAMIYVPEQGVFCLFPTNDVYNHDEGGIDYDYIDDLKDNYKAGKLKRCW